MKMEDKENKELITRMAESLREYAVPYKEGSWERFRRREGIPQKRVIPFWYWSSAAAAIVLLGLTLFLSGNPFGGRQENSESAVSHTTGKRVAEQPALAEQPSRKTESAPVGDSGFTQQVDKAIAFRQDRTPVNHEMPVEDFAGSLGVREATKTSVVETISTETIKAGAGPEKKEEASPLAHRTDPNPASGENEALLRMLSEGNANTQQTFHKLAKQDHEDKHWDFGVVVSPSLSNERVNMGGGVSVAYKITKKFSLGSGVSLVDLGFRQNAQAPAAGPPAMAASLTNATPMFSARNLESNELTSINTNVLALDIPIDLKYHVTSQFYASAGFSLFAVLNENRTNNYISRIPNAKTNSMQQYALSEPEFQVTNTSERSTERPLQGNSYSGFLNFSVGRQMPLSKSVGLSVEPFFKLPIGELSRQETDFKYGGVRVITSF